MRSLPAFLGSARCRMSLLPRPSCSAFKAIQTSRPMREAEHDTATNETFGKSTFVIVLHGDVARAGNHELLPASLEQAPQALSDPD